MKRIIFIPIAGTIAGMIAVALAHGKREGTPYPLLNEPPPRAPRTEPKPEPEPEPEPEKVKPKPPDVRRYLMELREDGTFAVTAMLRDKSAEREPIEHSSIEAFLDAAAPVGGARPTVRLYTTSEKVTPAELEKVAKQLRERCEVTIQPR